ncbi:MAG: MFS transporter, partial [Pseudorhodobacter sp.]|nr:MFS transporter [Pseudorhodobacter sp.]
ISVLAALILTGQPKLPKQPGPRQSLASELQSGLAALRAKPILRHIPALLTLSDFAMFFYSTLIAPLSRDLGQSPAGLGLTIGAVGAGGVVGALTLGSMTTRKPFVWIAGGATLSTLMVAAPGVAGLNASHPPLALIAVIFFAALGFATACALVPTHSLLWQHLTPDRMGRMTALSEAATALAILIAPFLGATLASHYGPGAAFLAGAGLPAVLALAAHCSAAAPQR